jgi:putative ATPase
MDLFEHSRRDQIEKESPLANRMRPRTLDEYAGQAHIVGPGRLLRRAIQADQLSSLIFYGPPGTGKTTLAMVIANSTRSHFITINAVLAGVKQIREAIETAQERRNLYNQRTTLFVDEVHRWNKAQQDALLPHVENGTIILIGATTENPYFEVNKALVSRSRIFQLRPLSETDLMQIARQALDDPERGYGKLDVQVDSDALAHLVDVANGDARGVLNALELAVETTEAGEDGRIHITLDVAEESIQKRAVLYDKEGDVHYDTISAFIKSLRGSDPDAALYWMAKMVYAGEDARFIFRRMTIFAGEDVGMADPNAINVVTSCWAAFERIGMPEGRFPLAQAAIYLATAPKSNSAFAFFDALNTVEQEQESDVPNHLKDGNRDKEGFGHGKGYLYPHAYRDHWVAQQYLPDGLQGKMFYEPSDQGYERQIRDEVARKREAQLAAMVGTDAPDEIGEVLTTSPVNKAKDAWLQRTISQSGRNLAQQRDVLFELAAVQRHHLVLDLNAGSGLLTWEAMRQAPEGAVWALTADSQSGDALRQQSSRLPELERPTILIGDLSEFDYLMTLRGEELLKFDRILARNMLAQDAGLITEIGQFVWGHLLANGRFCFAQTIPQHGQRLYNLIDWAEAPGVLAQQVHDAEEMIYADAVDPLVNWDESDLLKALQAVGFADVRERLTTEVQQRRITAEHITRWFSDGEAEQPRPTYANHLRAAGVSKSNMNWLQTLYRRQLQDQTISWQTKTVYMIVKI